MDSLPWIVLAVVVGVLVVTVVLGRRPGAGGARPDKRAGQIDALVKDGQLSAAARVALEAGQLDVAFDLFLGAHEPANAATVAVRRGDLRRAANLYEQVGNWEQAIYFYDKVGLHRHADTLRQTRLNEAPVAPAIDAAPAAPSRGAEPNVELPPPAIVATPAAIVPGEPAGVASRLDEVDLAAIAPPPAFAMDVVETRLDAPARPTRAAAGALLEEGNFNEAAELFAELGLDDEATHLWVNVLGEPGRAAPLVAGRGNHERAAELYELAGDVEAAAAAWIDAARASTRPDSFLERIVARSPTLALRYLEQELETRPLSAATAAWHYHKAKAVDRGGDARRAVTLYLALREEVGPYLDVDDRLDALSAALQPRATAVRTRRSSREPIELPPELASAPPPAETLVAAPPAEPPVAAPPAEPPVAAPPAEVDRDQLHQLAAQVADAAVDRMRRRSKMSTLPGPDPARAPAPDGREQSPFDAGLLDDSAVQAARRGPTLDSLQAAVAGRPCDVGTIEVFYRIGLAHQAHGHFDDALAAFEAVNEAWPGYRDGWERIEHLRRWKQALARSSHLAASDAVPGTERYEVRGELGRGRIAVVYRAFDRQLGRDVALKFLSEELSKQRVVRAAFQREARAAAALNHPNLVAVHDTGMLGGRAFLSMELVDGQPVAVLMREPGGLAIVESLRIMKQVLDGLTYTHGRALIHGDLKPANLVRTASGLVKVMDVGLAGSRTDGAQLAAIAGTPAYLAPEQLAGGDLDQRVDIFAAAVSLYEMLSHQLPFQGSDRATPPTRLTALVPAVPAQLEAAIMRGLAPDRDHRWRSAAELGGRIGVILHAVNAYVAGRSAPPAPPR